MNDNLGQPIAHGRTAEVYAWPENQVLKLFFDRYGLEELQYELDIARAVEASGFPVPGVGKIVQVGGRSGITYRRVEGVPMPEMVMRKPWNLIRYAHRMAELQAQMHTSPISAELPSLKNRLAKKIERAKVLPEVQRKKLSERLERMPDGKRLCHGDFHPNNIMMTAGGEVIIDWVDATRGNPLADVARTSILILGAIEAGEIKGALLRELFRLFHTAYLHRYFRLCPGGEDEYARWLPIVAGARLCEGIAELEGWLVSQAER